uniref:type VI secretion system baseplate subunit TssE n=1 Tax=Candidatus Electrothrix sp. TaxID=2170559 RepID=UPI004057A363
MLRERLLERITRLEKDKASLHKQAGVIGLTHSVQLHLERLLNTRQGSVPLAPDYGVPDITNVPGDSVQEVRQHIERILYQVVQKYEPRLAKIRIVMIEDSKHSFALRFRMEAVLAEQEDIPVNFETIVSTDGYVKVS